MLDGGARSPLRTRPAGAGARPSGQLGGRPVRLEASPGRILDIGTGTGAALELADRYPDAEVVGRDISAEMVNEVKSKWSLPAALVGTFKEGPNKAEHPGLMTERAGPVMNSNQLRFSERI